MGALFAGKRERGAVATHRLMRPRRWWGVGGELRGGDAEEVRERGVRVVLHLRGGVAAVGDGVPYHPQDHGSVEVVCR